LAKKLKVPLKIRYKQSLRALDEQVQIVECKKREKKGERQVRFKCQFSIKDKEIENIEVEVNKFNFIDQVVTIKSCSPEAVNFYKNVQKVGKKDKFKNKKLYIFENAKFYQNKKVFTIIGKIKERLFYNDQVTLTILNSEKNKGINVKCSFGQKKGKHIFTCNPDKDISGFLDGAYANLEDENLVINFNDKEKCDINFIVQKEENKNNDNDNDNDNNNDNANKNENKNKILKKKNDDEENQKEKKEDEGNESTIDSFFKNDYMIYAIMAFFLVIIIIFAYIFISRVRAPEEKKPTSENSSMDIIKYSSQGNEQNSNS
jgi:predicted RND superfamily exporter protein